MDLVIVDCNMPEMTGIEVIEQLRAHDASCEVPIFMITANNKRDVRHGYDLLADSDAPMRQVGAEIAHTHHEKCDGSGYPQGLEGDAIPLFGYIVAAADVFDALTSVRPYKRAWLLGDAKNFMLQGQGSHFDPGCVEALFGRVGRRASHSSAISRHRRIQQPR